MKSPFRSRAVRGSTIAVPNRRGPHRCRAGSRRRHSQSQQARAKNKPIRIERRLHRHRRTCYTGPEGFAYSKGLLQKWLKPYKVTIKGTAAFANGPLLTAALVGGSLQLGETR